MLVVEGCRDTNALIVNVLEIYGENDLIPYGIVTFDFDVQDADTGGLLSAGTPLVYWTRDELVSYALEFFLETAWRGTCHQYEKWQQELDERPSGATIRNQVASWSDVKRLASAMYTKAQL